MLSFLWVIKMTLYERIRQLRINAGMSQDDLARALGYKDRSMITKIEAGKVDISQKKILAFALALNTTPSYLMGWSDTNPGATPATEDHAERELLHIYRSLSFRGKNLMMERAKELLLLYGKKSEGDPAQPVSGESV